jgi:hypothetical protein
VLVYRDGKREVRSAELHDALCRSLRHLVHSTSAGEDLLTDALLRAGELECALTDAGDPSARIFAEVTDVLAGALVSSNGRENCIPYFATYLDRIADLPLPASVRVSAPEGFAYYALHPMRYAEMTQQLDLARTDVFVIGLRTIGTTLSAVVAAAARRRGCAVERITVRPSGHPFDRRTEFHAAHEKQIRDAATRRTKFLVVDEGPGLSGSSLLSAADALENVGVSRADIVVLCAHQPNPNALCAPRAAERWSRVRVVAAQPKLDLPDDAASDWSGGQWRSHLYANSASWPAAWPQVERLKFFSCDGARLYKFEGIGPYGAAPMERSQIAAAAGWSPRVESARQGFATYARIPGRPLIHSDLDENLLELLARYCDFRRREMACPECSLEPLREMLRVNLAEEFGDAREEDDAAEIVHPVITDSRLMPHEWLLDPNRRIWKTDLASHGDDHFYPGPTDIAWDLAGAIVEWRMNDASAEAFLSHYQKLSGDDARARLPFFLCAYTAFRLGFCRMAAQACAEERERFAQAAEYYRSVLLRSESLSLSVSQSVS